MRLLGWTTITLLVLVMSKANSLEYISPKQAEALADQFTLAHRPNPEDIEMLSAKAWNCDLFGMRTRLQVERNLVLYKFTRGEKGWNNQGVQVISSYDQETLAFVGRSGQLRDEIRLNSKGQLISRLSSNANVVLAYALCSSRSSI